VAKNCSISLDLFPFAHKNTFNFKVLGPHGVGILIAILPEREDRGSKPNG
jgi:hypothetical protein